MTQRTEPAERAAGRLARRPAPGEPPTVTRPRADRLLAEAPPRRRAPDAQARGRAIGGAAPGGPSTTDRATDPTVAASLGRLRASASLEATAAAIVAEVAATLRLPAVAIEEIVGAGASRRVVPLAVLTDGEAPIQVGRPIPAERGRYLIERAGRGPWVDDLTVGSDSAFLAAWRAAGLVAAAYLPIGDPGTPSAILVAGAPDRDPDRLGRLLPDLLEYTAVALSLLGPRLAARRATDDLRRDIERIIRGGRFRPVFQPIFDLDRAIAVGHEALTRFADERPPDLVFQQAAGVGLGLELEIATLRKILEVAGRLPFGALLSVNASPELITSGRLETVLPPWRGRIVLEVTEHDLVADYPAVRVAMAGLAPVRLAVDDAGAGFASLRHIIELEPDFVKLDMGLVRGIDGDPARQGLVAGMAYFAIRTDRTLIAEGIETAAERDMLRSLGIRLGQGFLLGRPAALGRRG